MQQQQYPSQQGQGLPQSQPQQPVYPASMQPAQQYQPYPAQMAAQQQQAYPSAQATQQQSYPPTSYPQQQQQWPSAPAPAPQPSMSGPGPKPRAGLTPVKITAIVMAVVIIGVGALLGYKFFAPKSGTANDSNPFANASTPAATTTAGTTTSVPTAGTSGPVVLATGAFIDTGSGDHGSGNVTIGKTADGKFVIHLDNLNVVAGPDLHVYLAVPANPSSADQVTNGGVDLGSLAANQGSVNVDVPADVGNSLSKYKSVVIYCKSFAVIFTVAPLSFQNY